MKREVEERLLKIKQIRSEEAVLLQALIANCLTQENLYQIQMPAEPVKSSSSKGRADCKLTFHKYLLN